MKFKKTEYRSGLEEQIAKQLESGNIPFEYESVVLKYMVPESDHAYTPDFILKKKNKTSSSGAKDTENGGGCMFIEVKGYLDLEMRKKYKSIRHSNPDADIRFLFGNWDNKIRKGSKKTYRMWAEGLGFKCANKEIPRSWIYEVDKI